MRKIGKLPPPVHLQWGDHHYHQLPVIFLYSIKASYDDYIYIRTILLNFYFFFMLHERDTGCNPKFDMMNYNSIELTYMVLIEDL